MVFVPSSPPGILHHFSHDLVAFEHAGSNSELPPPTAHTLLFVGGLYDGLFTVKYTKPLALALPPTWRFVQPLLSSSYHGWGTSSLGKDVNELVQCISYVLTIRPHGKIVLMGHSTGSQDIMHYLLSPSQENEPPRPHLAGAIMQAGVSDRESFAMHLPAGIYETSVQTAEKYVSEGRGEDVLPLFTLGGLFPGVPVCARRWLSLISPPPAHDGEDDYFSSDFSEERLRGTFGRMGQTGTPVQILYSEKDQYVPERVDKRELVEKWERIIREGAGVVDAGSGIVKGADHAVETAGEEVVEDLVKRVVDFLDKVEKTR